MSLASSLRTFLVTFALGACTLPQGAQASPAIPQATPPAVPHAVSRAVSTGHSATHASLTDAELRSVFGDSYFDSARDHNCDLDTVALLREARRVGAKPFVLVHIDYHADIMRNNEHVTIRHEGIGNYINRLISDETVSEVYWVLPPSSATRAQRGYFWLDRRTSDVYFNDGPHDQTLYLNGKTHQILFHKPTDPKVLQGLKAVRVHKRLLDALPSFADLQQPLWIDIDADYFSNTGIWTRGKAGVRFAPAQLQRELAGLVHVLAAHQAHPLLTTGSLSPGFTYLDDIPTFQRFFARLGACSRTGESVVFRHRRSDRGDGEYGNRLHGRAVPLAERREYRAVYHLEALDLLQGQGTGRIPLLPARSSLYQAAQRVVQGIYGGTPAQARQTLWNMSKLTQSVGHSIDLPRLRAWYEAPLSRSASLPAQPQHARKQSNSKQSNSRQHASPLPQARQSRPSATPVTQNLLR